MMKRFPGLFFWILLGLALVVAPLACGGDENNRPDAAGALFPDSMTGG